MHPEELFLVRFKQLNEILRRDPRDQLLDLALVLRQLLVDEFPLVHQVNRIHQLPIYFTVGLSVRERIEEMQALGIPAPEVFMLGFPPPNEPKKQLKLGQLLAHEVVKIRDNYYTTHDLLDACANKMGGVHYDAEGSTHQIVRDLTSLGEFFAKMGIGSAFSVLLFLARVAYAGLVPIAEAATGGGSSNTR